LLLSKILPCEFCKAHRLAYGPCDFFITTGGIEPL
jgi:hypothetical protein